MKSLLILSPQVYLLFLVLFMITACTSDPASKSNQNSNKQALAASVPQDSAQTLSTASVSEDTVEMPGSSLDSNGGVAPLVPAETKPVVSTTATGNGGLAARLVSENKITTVLEQVARDVEDRKLTYDSKLGQDCSGIYHQLKDSIQVRIPALAHQSKYTYPSFRNVRSSRQIADWYYRNNNLHIVQDATADRNKIRPGSVMFYGRTDEKYSNLNIDMLTNPGKFVHDSQTGKGKIMHIAVVTSVVKDEQGNVTKYTIMHGRNKKHPASRSGGNYDGPGNYAKQHAKFPFGNWNQQWVAVAHIETPVQ